MLIEGQYLGYVWLAISTTPRVSCHSQQNFDWCSLFLCPDIDECRTVPGVCQNGRCYNTQGGYRCDCNPGYETSEDGKACFGESLICVCRRVCGRPPGCPPPHPPHHHHPSTHLCLSLWVYHEVVVLSVLYLSVYKADMSVLYLHHWKMKFNHSVSLSLFFSLSCPLPLRLPLHLPLRLHPPPPPPPTTSFHIKIYFIFSCWQKYAKSLQYLCRSSV